MKVRLVVAGIALGVFGLGSTAFSAGFALVEQSVSGLGTAFSGSAGAQDATTVFTNPAGMTLLEGTQTAGALHYINPSAKFHKQSAQNAVPLALGGPNNISGGEGGNAGKVGYVPNLYATSNFGKVAVGLGINAPFGLATEYSADWVGRYHALKSSVRTMNINPAVAFKVGNRLNLGVGVNAQYLDVQLTNMVDFGLATLSSHLTPALASNQNMDIYSDLKADSWGFGWNVGALYQYADHGRLGLAYRSQIEHSVEGDGNFTVRNPAFIGAVSPLLLGAATAYFPDQGVSGDITLPATASLNVYHEITPSWAVMADVTWTEWSTFDKLVIKFDQGVGSGLATKQSVTTENWDDNWRYSIGTTVKTSDALTLRGGLAYDQSPIASATYRTPRIPDEDRFWIALGGSYKLNEQISLELGYAHLFVKDAKLDKQFSDPENLSKGSLVGEYQNHVDIASAQLNYRF